MQSLHTSTMLIAFCKIGDNMLIWQDQLSVNMKVYCLTRLGIQNRLHYILLPIFVLDKTTHA